MSKLALIAIGGNSLVRAGERASIDEQTANAHHAARSIARLHKRGWRIVVTHGNGPQVGAALLRSERAAAEVYTLPLDFCVAATQSEIGCILQRAIEYELSRLRLSTPVMTVLTQVRVDPSDPAFQSPTKPIGPFYSRRTAEEKQHQLGWTLVEIPGRGYRRVVPSPEPIEILEQEKIRQLLDLGMIVIAVGGGGIPVIEDEHHNVTGAEAVIDKDPASALLASHLKVDLFLISTDTEYVYLDFKKPTQRSLKRVTSCVMQQYLDEGHFPPGSMGPKIESAIRFLATGGTEVIIACPDMLLDAIDGRSGTHIVPDTTDR